MSSGDITRYVITVSFHDASLTELNEINNAFTRANFLLTLTDEEGNIHELG
ncbi:type V toxin-antitoxin system endoribonuclease antitoxin GhoS, partial [Enterobacter sp.]